MIDYFFALVALVACVFGFKLHIKNKRMEKEINEFERRSRDHAVRGAQRVAAVHQEYAEKNVPDPKNRADFESTTQR